MLVPKERRAFPWHGSGAASVGVSPPDALTNPAEPFPRPHARVREGSWKIQRTSMETALAFLVRRFDARSTTTETQWLAYADGMVTGRHGCDAWHRFRKGKRFEDIRDAVGAGPEHLAALQKIVTRMDEVVTHLSHAADPSGHDARPPFSPTHGSPYIGVNAEADVPRRPVNVPVTRYQQHDLHFTVPSIRGGLDVRYVQYGRIEPSTQVLLYLHGLGSRAEEAERIAEALCRLGDYAVLAPDLPGHGCTTRPPHDDELGLRYRDGRPPQGFVYLEKLERFVASFVRAASAQHPGLEAQLALVAGGSLGGTLAMRLSMDGAPYTPRRVAFWSPAGLWGSFSADSFKREHVADLLLDKATADDFSDPAGTVPLGRKHYFDFNFVDAPWPVSLRNCQRWWSQAFLLHYANAPIRAAIADRLETYGPSMRRWQMRLAYEQLCFSVHHTDTRRLIGGEDGRCPVLLLCGREDNDLGATVYDNSVALERYLREEKRQVGRAVWVTDGGHSLHDECPQVLAEEIDAFLRDVR